jgi:NAD(P)-dependent dehydrogenase (short-subunit alcohol dehydrogenase family)
MMSLFDLDGKVAIVTGGNRGIGLGVTRALAEAGATVVIANRNASGGEMTADALRQEGLKVDAIPADVSSVSSIRRMVAGVVEKYKSIDILVNNAGISIEKPAEEVTEEDWDGLMGINLRGVFFCSQAAGREMLKRKRGNIINISSVNSIIVGDNRSVYCGAKGGMTMLTKCLAIEWAEYGIRVNALAPGFTITDLNQEYLKAHPDELHRMLNNIPLARAADVMDYAGAVLFLASDASNYVTGQTLFVDGGMTIGRVAPKVGRHSEED